MKVLPTELPGVVIVEPQAFGDDRGWFMESYHEGKFHQGAAGLGGCPCRAPSCRTTTRAHAAARCVGCTTSCPRTRRASWCGWTQGPGVGTWRWDIRRGSAHFGRWVGVELSAQNRRPAVDPRGLRARPSWRWRDDTHFLYKTTDVYAKDCERAIVWNDPDLAIAWPLEGLEPLLAAKDAAAAGFRGAEVF